MAKLKPSEVTFNLGMVVRDFPKKKTWLAITLGCVDSGDERADDLGEWNISGLPKWFGDNYQPYECLFFFEPTEYDEARATSDMIAAGFKLDKELDYDY